MAWNLSGDRGGIGGFNPGFDQSGGETWQQAKTVDPSQKGKDWCLSYAKASWSDYTNHGTQSFHNNRGTYSKIKDYAQGNQAVRYLNFSGYQPTVLGAYFVKHRNPLREQDQNEHGSLVYLEMFSKPFPKPRPSDLLFPIARLDILIHQNVMKFL